MVLFSEKKIVIYELKGYRVTKLHKAWSNNKDWFVEKQNKPGKIYREKSFFRQCSRSRKFLLEFLEREIRPLINGECDFDIDVRLVFKEGSDLSRFYYAPPRVINRESFEEVILQMDSEIGDFIKNCYSLSGDKYRMISLASVDFAKLAEICFKEEIFIRTSKWFTLIKEDELIEDLRENTGTSGIHFPRIHIS